RVRSLRSQRPPAALVIRNRCLYPFFVRSLLLDIGVNDLIDIALVSILLYATLIWLRHTRAAFVGIGILILGGIYVVARALGLQLTAWIFQGFFAIFLIIIVVIFQEELKQLFERVAVLSLRRRRDARLRPHSMDTLIGCLADFAKDRIGAIVVVPGKDPVERHVSGGIELDGRLSEPLLRSIFDTNSPGHDGAVILQGDRVLRFATHLPLSKDFEQLSRLGTRHSAALGLAELTDALCLVVSEERGTISVARDGRLRNVATAQEASFLLQEFLRSKAPVREVRRVSVESLQANWKEKASAVAIVVGLWFLFVPGSTTSRVTLRVPVTVENLPSDLVLNGVEPKEVEATFSGVRRAFYLFERNRLRVTIDGSLASLGRRTFKISEQNIRLPPEVVLEDVEPPAVKITVGRNVEPERSL
ncbi:MAG: diadenylate cyclase, partial [Candidatus Binatia bacterium]